MLLQIPVQKALLEDADLFHVIHQSVSLVDALDKVFDALAMFNSALKLTVSVTFIRTDFLANLQRVRIPTIGNNGLIEFIFVLKF